MKTASDSVSMLPIKIEERKQVLRRDDFPVLTLSYQIPKIPDQSRGLRRLSHYCERLVHQWQTYWEGPLFDRAQAAAQAAQNRSLPFQPWEATLSCTHLYQSQGIVSLCLEAQEKTGCSRIRTLRQSEVWQVSQGLPCTLSSFFPDKPHWRKTLLSQLQALIDQQIQSGEHLYVEDWPRQLRKQFDPEHFFLSPEGLCLFFPLCTIAPYFEGLPTFCIPLATIGPAEDTPCPPLEKK